MAQYEVLDISKYDTVSDYRTVASNIDGVVIRAGYRGYGSTGSLVLDSKFEDHYKGFHQYTKVGVYWTTQAISNEEAIKEAEYLYSIIKTKNISFPIYIDSDYANTSHTGRADNLSAEERTEYIITFLEKMKSFGYKVGVLANDNWFVTNLKLQTLYDKNYSIWVSKFSNAYPKNVTQYDGWQYTNTGNVQGIAGDVTLTHFYADVAGWDLSYPISDVVKGISQTTYVYDGTPHTPEVRFSKTMMWNIDYTISYSNNIDIGQATVAIIGKGIYTGIISYPFYIIAPEKIDITPYITGLTPSSFIYYGNQCIPEINTELQKNIDYEVHFINNIEIGTATAIVSGIGDYSGSIELHFEISDQENEKTYIGNVVNGLSRTSFDFTGLPIEPGVITNISSNNYSVSYMNNINAGTATCRIYGINECYGSVSYTFEIKPLNISSCVSNINPSEFLYSGEECKPLPIISNSRITKDDYICKYENNIAIGIGVVEITGINNMTGTMKYGFEIKSPYGNLKLIIDYISELADPTEYLYTGEEHRPRVNPNGLTEDIDFTVVYTDNINAGTAMCTVTGIGKYIGTVNLPFTIDKLDMSYYTCWLETASFVFDGTAKEPVVRITGLVKDVDFAVYYRNNIAAGTATAIANGINNYYGSISRTFKITSSTLDDLEITLDKHTYKYTGQPIEPVAKISGLVEGQDFTVSYENNIELGTGVIIATGINNWKGSCSTTFTISEMSLEDLFLTVVPTNLNYTGEQQYPQAYIYRLVEGEDYELIYPEESKDVGSYIIYAVGKGDYQGIINAEYTIGGKSIGNYEAYLDSYVFKYTSDYIEPKVHIDGLVEGIDFNVIYTNNYNIGTARATIYGMGNYSGSIFVEFQIIQCSITECIGKYGYATLKSLYRVAELGSELKIYASQEAYEKGAEPLIDQFDYIIMDSYYQYIEDFILVTFKVKGLGGFYDDVTYRFRIITKEPSKEIDYNDDGVYNFGDVDLQDETAEGSYNFGELESPSDVPEEDEKVHDGDNYDFDALSTMYLAHYDEDNGKNIDVNGNEIGDTTVPIEDNDDGVYNFGDIDLGDETAEGDYDFGDLDEGVEEDSVAVDDYDFNVLSGDKQEGYAAGTEFTLKNTPVYSTFSSKTTNTKRSGLFYIYESTVVNNRIRVTKREDGVGEPARASGWVSMDDLARLEKLMVGDPVMVEGNIYVYANGKGGYIKKNGEIMYIVDILDEAYDYPYALASTITGTKQGYANIDLITRVDDV